MLARVSSLAVAAAVVAVAVAPHAADAHSSMSVPKPTWPANFYTMMNPVGNVDGDKFAGAASIPSYKGLEKLNAAYKSSGAKTVRQFMMENINVTVAGATKECGMSVEAGVRQPIPDEVVWSWVHVGPCEIWCDNNRIFYNENCQGNKVGNVKVDKAKCEGASFLQGMYFGTHVPKWEVYVNCAPLVGGTATDASKVFKTNAAGDGATGADADTSASASTPASSSDENDTPPATTAATTTAPASSSDDENDTPAATTTAPATASPASTSAPSATTKSSCVKRRRN